MNQAIEAQRLEVTLIKLIESHNINPDDYNLIHQHLIKIKKHDTLKPIKKLPITTCCEG